MSYCVNCGVQLERSLTECPLCHTPVCNPNREIDTDQQTPYAIKSREVPISVKRYSAVLLSSILAAPALVCLVVNLLFLSGGFWAIFPISACAFLWVAVVLPLLLKTHWPSVYVFIDTVTLLFLVGVISLVRDGEMWFLVLARPIIIAVGLCALILAELIYRKKLRIAHLVILIIMMLALLCIVIEIVTDYYLHGRVELVWSLVVLISCSAVALVLYAIARNPKIHEQLMRKLHI